MWRAGCTRRVAAECPSLPPIAWVGDSRRTRRRRPRRRPRRLHRAWPGSRRAAGDDGGGATAQPRARRLRLQRSPCSWPRRSACRRASWPPRSPSELGQAPGDQVGRDRRPGLPEHPARRGRRRRAGPRRSSRPAPAYGRSDAPRRPEDQPGVRLGQPDRPDPPRRRPLGRGRRRAEPAAARPPAPRSAREYYFNDAGSQIDRFARSLLAAAKGEPTPEDGYAGEYIAEIADAGASRRARTCSTARRRSRAGGLPGRGRRADVRRDQAVAGATSGCEFDVYFNEKDLHDRGELDARPRAGCASRATSTRPTARSGCAPPTSATTRTGCCASPTASGPTSPPTAPTTSTSASAASTGVVIMLGADHHGYIGRMQGDGGLLRRRPGPQPGDPHRPAGQPGPRRRSRCG